MVADVLLQRGRRCSRRRGSAPLVVVDELGSASTRPALFTPERPSTAHSARPEHAASTRPALFTPERVPAESWLQPGRVASTRPALFTPERRAWARSPTRATRASTRPALFTPERACGMAAWALRCTASTRPALFTPERMDGITKTVLKLSGFNEAGVVHAGEDRAGQCPSDRTLALQRGRRCSRRRGRGASGS